MFLIFWNFRGSFLSLIFGFWKFQNCMFNHDSHFGGSVLYNFFIWGLLIYVYDSFGTLGGLFWVWFLVLKHLKLYFESQFPLLGGLFYKTFLFEASLYMFLIFGNFRGSFLSSTFGFESEFPLLVGSVLYNILIWGLLIYVFNFLEL